MRDTIRTAALLACVLTSWRALAAPQPGPAQSAQPSARAYYQSGIAHYNTLEWQAALDDFKRAYQLKPNADLLFNIAQCYRQIGDPQNAILEYRAYLRERPSATNRADVQKLISDMNEALAHPRPKPEPPRSEPAPEPPREQATTARPDLTTRPPDRPAPTPLYKKWWLWTAVGGAVAVGLAVGLGVGLTQPYSYPSVSTTGGTFRF